MEHSVKRPRKSEKTISATTEVCVLGFVTKIWLIKKQIWSALGLSSSDLMRQHSSSWISQVGVRCYVHVSAIQTLQHFEVDITHWVKIKKLSETYIC